jgi:hypothetical protein
MLSSFTSLAESGLAIVIVVVFSLIGAIVIMPATLILVGGIGNELVLTSLLDHKRYFLTFPIRVIGTITFIEEFS